MDGIEKLVGVGGGADVDVGKGGPLQGGRGVKKESGGRGGGEPTRRRGGGEAKRQQEAAVGRRGLYRDRVLVSDLIRGRKRAVVAVERGSLAASGKGLSLEILRGDVGE